MAKSLLFEAEYVNELFVKKKTYFLDCTKITPIGVQVVRCFDEEYNIVAKRCFLIQVGVEILGSSQFNSLNAFMNYMNSQCQCCPSPNDFCNFFVGDCQVVVENCLVSIKKDGL